MATINSCDFGTGTSGQVLTSNGPGVAPTFQAATGGVTGPGSSTDRAIATWNGTGGTALFNNSTAKIDSSGRMTNTSQPAFLVEASSQLNVTGDGTVYTVAWATEIADQGGNFASNTFTAPVTGLYFLSANVEASGLTTSMTVGGFTIVTTARSYGQTLDAAKVFDNNTNATYQVNTVANMTAGDTAIVQLALYNGTKVADINAGSFSGFLIC